VGISRTHRQIGVTLVAPYSILLLSGSCSDKLGISSDSASFGVSADKVDGDGKFASKAPVDAVWRDEAAAGGAHEEIVER
jgi:hypothetical protein